MVRLNFVRAALPVLVLLAGACDGGASAVPVRQEATASPAAASGEAPADGFRRGDDPRAAPVPQIDGKPMWSANRRYTAEQNARRGFERNGDDFGAASVKEYVAKAHAFVADPPKGAQTLTRSNGDKLIYDPAGNIFAVVTAEGAPRTMFKPDTGAEYWKQVKQQEAEGGSSRSRRGRDGGSESGGG